MSPSRASRVKHADVERTPPFYPAPHTLTQVKLFVNGSIPTPAPVVQTPSPSMPPTAFPASVSNPAPSAPPGGATIEPTSQSPDTESPVPLTLSPAAAETPVPTGWAKGYDYHRGGGKDLGIVGVAFGGGFVLLSLVAVMVISLSRKALNPVLKHPLGESRGGDFA